MPGARILVVDPDASAVDTLRAVLEGQGHRVETAGSPDQARAGVGLSGWDVVFAALDPGDPDGAATLRDLGRGRAALTIALVPAGAGARGLAARDVGAYAFLEKPADLTREKILTVVANALEHHRLREELDDLRRERPAPPAAPPVRLTDGPDTLNLEERERQAILQALESTHWNKQAAAGLLGLHRPTLYSKMRKHGIPQKRPV
jgi:DNA-binding NtrC family response regulator